MAFLLGILLLTLAASRHSKDLNLNLHKHRAHRMRRHRMSWRVAGWMERQREMLAAAAAVCYYCWGSHEPSEQNRRSMIFNGTLKSGNWCYNIIIWLHNWFCGSWWKASERDQLPRASRIRVSLRSRKPSHYRPKHVVRHFHSQIWWHGAEPIGFGWFSRSFYVSHLKNETKCSNNTQLASCASCCCSLRLLWLSISRPDKRHVITGSGEQK